ncbi:M15 family metallopeptidase [Actinokineospora auranticolor]|uniref:D-alanyl-D-alanine carboxypeptidase-like protein n=1 Tax=Actinokineospora auranticolor TaxID=155976 RepID=A0A2S6GFE7_9PSEU|nr:M15 family metallopeptidase [Actinokineospora auranticolor]PPK63949.1 D-alanyl-D-alanine carboxypeptidase-like protein [Actinokineospora auranticolor]
MHRTAVLAAAALTALVTVAGCVTPEQQRASQLQTTPPSRPAPTVTTPPPTPPPTTTTTASPTPTTTTAPPTAAAPAWVVGAHPLPRRSDGFGEVLTTPPVLVNRSLPTKDLLPPPAGDGYRSTVAEVPDAVLNRSTWQPSCPVTRADLRYLTMSFWGFDGRAHTGEMIVNARVAADVTRVFGQLFAARFPLEEMRVTALSEMDLPPTGDGNNTGAFVCRPTRGATTWSAHAYGLAVDVNPFCNPYRKGSLVLPELASSYVDRSNRRPGMVLPGEVVTRAFAGIGWAWGGTWTSPVDLQHFSATGK